ncbi:DUF3833 domain-containing protein [Sulfitobacter sp. S190]|uniref:DUF3833 domain-containing protein n=1 Tax=Sulfitobacter sp. S190 TaxID=2867022 RepID=UPI0021A63FA2|nr:DUF3833 domain-containing protein [Sulfitobacter sp. S190]UWR23009.1 DUF3833 domain-containing protein [Sulfitobacter sp. S190]
MRYFWMAGAVALSACVGKPGLDDPKLSQADFDLEEYFDGRVTAKGQFQDVFGTVRRRFDVVINGSWDGETLTLVEDFAYADGSTEQRVWRLRKTGPVTADQTWTGFADGVIGTAQGQEKGDTFNWTYKIDLPVPDGTLRVNFDDWMWDLGGGTVLNRAYMKKAGIDIGEVIITFERP